MGYSMEHSLFNTNHLRYYGVKVKDNPTSDETMYIIIRDESFNMELETNSIIVFVETHTPSSRELSECPHIVMSFPLEWKP